jgi:hypothetical protein
VFRPTPPRLPEQSQTATTCAAEPPSNAGCSPVATPATGARRAGRSVLRAAFTSYAVPTIAVSRLIRQAIGQLRHVSDQQQLLAHNGSMRR